VQGRSIKLMALACASGIFIAFAVALKWLEHDLVATRRAPAAPAPIAERSPAPAPTPLAEGSPSTAPAPLAERIPSHTPSASAGAGIDPSAVDTLSDARAFVDEWFSTTNTVRSADELRRFYASAVDYYGRPRVTRDSVARDKSYFLRRWTRREFRIAGEPQLEPAGRRRAVRAHFPYSYRVSNAKETLRGMGTVDLVVAQVDGRWMIVSEQGTPSRR
jgi:hypothetical protein